MTFYALKGVWAEIGMQLECKRGKLLGLVPNATRHGENALETGQPDLL